MSDYSAAMKRQMVRFYISLNKRDRRRYAAIEAQKLEHGGIHFVSRLLKCDPTIVATIVNDHGFPSYGKGNLFSGYSCVFR